jgi:hypothetical protein
LTDDFGIGIEIGLFKIVDQMPALADQFQKAPAAAVILLEFLQMFRQMVDALRQQGDLNLGRPGVFNMPLEFQHNVTLLLLGEHAGVPPYFGDERISLP